MSNDEIIRAWKEDEPNSELPPQESDALPGNPAGEIELTDSDLEVVAGGENKTDKTICQGTCGVWTYGCCALPE